MPQSSTPCAGPTAIVGSLLGCPAPPRHRSISITGISGVLGDRSQRRRATRRGGGAPDLAQIQDPQWKPDHQRQQEEAREVEGDTRRLGAAASGGRPGRGREQRGWVDGCGLPRSNGRERERTMWTAAAQRQRVRVQCTNAAPEVEIVHTY